MIDIHHITFSYPGAGLPVFQDFSASLGSGHVYGLLGRNGTGKSTLLYLIAGLLRAQEGEVLVDGEQSCRRRPHLLEGIFMLPEEFELPGIPLDEYMQLYRPFYPRFDPGLFNHCLSGFDLDSSLHLRQLSMGQKKKVFMSFALATRTPLLLMDEPTNGLDIPSKSQFRKLVAESMDDDRTIIISTHLVHDVEQLLDHVLILDNKRMLLDAPMERLSGRYRFETRLPQEMDDSVVYAEPSLMGNLVVAHRSEGDAETPVNLELLFNAVTQGLIHE